MGLRVKFNLVLVISMLLLVALLQFFHQRQINLQNNKHLTQKAQELAFLSESIRRYTNEEISPLLERLDQGFLPQSIASYAATEIFNHNDAQNSSQHHVALLNAQIPRYQANAWQRDLIQEFQAEPELPMISAHMLDASGPFFVWAYPVKNNEQIHGVKLIRINTKEGQEFVNNSNNQYLIQLLAAAFLMVVIVNVIMHWMLFKPLSQIAAQGLAISRGEANITAMDEADSYELNTVAQAFNRLYRSLQAAMNHLS